jgi:hypothetical protein
MFLMHMCMQVYILMYTCMQVYMYVCIWWEDDYIEIIYLKRRVCMNKCTHVCVYIHMKYICREIDTRTYVDRCKWKKRCFYERYVHINTRIYAPMCMRACIFMLHARIPSSYMHTCVNACIHKCTRTILKWVSSRHSWKKNEFKNVHRICKIFKFKELNLKMYNTRFYTEIRMCDMHAHTHSSNIRAINMFTYVYLHTFTILNVETSPYSIHTGIYKIIEGLFPAFQRFPSGKLLL